MNRLLDMGFVPVGNWVLVNENLQYNITAHYTATNVLYAFAVDGEVKYIGKTKMQLVQRMYGYQQPGPTQSTNTRVKSAIVQYLQQQQDHTVDILVFVDNGLLRYGNFRINLAAGLEDDMIYKINPEWNIAGRNRVAEDANSENPALAQEPLPTEALIQPQQTAQVTIGTAFYNQGFINLGVNYSNLIGPNNAPIEILLGLEGTQIVQGYINRTANRNGTPRIMGGVLMRDWIKRNFSLNETMQVDILSPNSIRLH